MKDEWRFVLEEAMGLFVMTDGTPGMHPLSADSWGSQQMVSTVASEDVSLVSCTYIPLSI